jgi:Protein of unknown function (DUF3429)
VSTPAINPSQTTINVARLLGLAGAIPFVFAAIAIHFDVWLPRAQAINLAVVYAAVILSFLGGIHWGYSVMLVQAGRGRDAGLLFAVSVLPALAAWTTLLLTTLQHAIWLQVTWFILVWFVDWQLSRRQLVPAWFMGLRTIITLLVVIALLVISGVSLSWAAL